MDELVYQVAGSAAKRASPITLAEAGLKERGHLQEWVLAHPVMLGPGLLVITSECDRWSSARGRERDRLDVLAFDTDGHLVVVELKRDLAPETVELRALKYAACCSRFTPETLAAEYRVWRAGRGERRPLRWAGEEAAELGATGDFTVTGLVPDSGGAGRWRGGCGLELSFRVREEGARLLARGLERQCFRPWGVRGGGAGTARGVVGERRGPWARWTCCR